MRMISLLFVVLLQSHSAMQSTLQAQIRVLTLVIKDCHQNFKIYWAEIRCQIHLSLESVSLSLSKCPTPIHCELSSPHPE